MTGRHFLMAALAAFLSLCAAAQDYAEYYRYAEEAQEKSMLFRGKEGVSYGFQHNGTPYWYSRTFTSGDVLYNGKLYRGVLVNVNAHTQELQVKQNESLMPVLADRDYVDWFTMDSRMYVNLRKRGTDTAEEGFYEVIHEGGASLYKRVDKIIRKDANNKNGTAIGYDDPLYNEKVYDYFANKVRYFFLKDGHWHQVKDIQALVRCCPERKKELKAFVKSSGLNKKTDFDKAGEMLLKYIDNE